MSCRKEGSFSHYQTSCGRSHPAEACLAWASERDRCGAWNLQVETVLERLVSAAVADVSMVVAVVDSLKNVNYYYLVLV